MTILAVKERLKRLLEQIELATGQKPSSEYRRASWRYKWVTPATVEVLDSKVSSELMYVAARTICAEGLDFHCPRKLNRGCKILITLETPERELQIPATVRHSTESVGMPIVGVTFDP